MTTATRTYFAADFHFGLDLEGNLSIDRERKFVRWMDSIKANCRELYLLGDTFDYWFEYNSCIPKGYSRVLGKLAEFVDSGIRVVIFIGNHDIWMRDYLEKEVGAEIVRSSIDVEIDGRSIYMAHGDGLGDPSMGFRLLRKFFHNKVCQWLYKWVHPDVTIPFGNWWSHHNRVKKIGNRAEQYLGETNEYLVKWSKEQEANGNHHDFYIFGHRHIELNFMISQKSTTIILGNWINKFTFAYMEEGVVSLDNFTELADENCCDLSDVV